MRVFDRHLSPLEINYLHTQGNPDINLADYREFRVMTDPELLAARESLRAVESEHNQLYSWLPEIMVMGDDPFAEPMHVKKRGVYTELGEEVEGRLSTRSLPGMSRYQMIAWDWRNGFSMTRTL